MIKPDWDLFKAKFSENPQYNFEWFCYLLFCEEFDKPYGIFRYKNQSAIETNTIEVDGHEIGFQAKYYDSTLSNHKNEILETITKAKRDYPGIKQLILYTNQEWGQAYEKAPKPTKAKKPQGQVEIEEKANELNLELQWRTSSYFESSFVTVDCKKISKNFFSDYKTVLNFIDQQELHTKSLLDNIHSTMSYRGSTFSLGRDDILEKLEYCSEEISILSGTGGVGKTVEIKRLYHRLKKHVPFFVFKATELELNRLGDFSSEGSIYEFAECYGDSDKKVVVIDSAEKLLDLSNQDPAKEFLKLLISNHWRIIFTTRDHYFDDLNFLCLEVYRLAPLKIHISELDSDSLFDLSIKHEFTLPTDQKLLSLLKIPLYLSEFLSMSDGEQPFNYCNFKRKIWDTRVKKSKVSREQIFIALALKRANRGSLFLTPENDELEIAESLAKDGLLGHEKSAFFIAHDIYEEWALEKHIDLEFTRKASKISFFESIGHSLAIRRSFRGWVSEKLLLNDESVKTFLDELIEDEEVLPCWKDEIIVSILLSNYSESFFERFEDELLSNDLELAKHICFMLRIACKEVDDDLLVNMGLKKTLSLPYEHLFTKPKGTGWSSLIKFVSNNIDKIGVENIKFVLPILNEWNSKFKSGETTRLASLTALAFYEWTNAEDVYTSSSDTETKLLNTVAYGAAEIKSELSNIFRKVVENKYSEHRDPYVSLCKLVLTKDEGIAVVRELPDETISLANLFWLKDYSKDNSHYRRGDERESRHGITDDHDLKYHPASAYQTPTYWLLNSSPKKAINFILDFIGKTTDNITEFYGKDNFTIAKVVLSDCSVDHYTDAALWGAYRGTGDSPYLLSSILMALEKFLLTYGDSFDSDTLEKLLIYMLKHTNSSSISAVVSSIVQAFPEKTFNVAKILFNVKDFFTCDLQRQLHDSRKKNELLGLKNMFGGLSRNELYVSERLKACDEDHRRKSLENLCLEYQMFRDNSLSEEEFSSRQNNIWSILDSHYGKLSDEDDSNGLKAWKLCLARMDRRNMDIEVKEVDRGVEVHFNPKLEPGLKQYSETSQKNILEKYKFANLRFWSEHKLKCNDDYTKYKQYENSPISALVESKEIISQLNTHRESADIAGDVESFHFTNHSTPLYVCATLIKHHLNELDDADIEFCKEHIIDSLRVLFSSYYSYQIGDGIEACIFVLPDLLVKFPENNADIKLTLLITLFNDHPITMLDGGRFYELAINAIQSIWKTSPKDAESLLLGCLALRHKYFELMRVLRKENHKKGAIDFRYDDLLPRFIDENKSTIELMISNGLDRRIVGDICGLKLGDKQIALRLIPNNSNRLGQELFSDIVKSTARTLLSDDRDDKQNFVDRLEFLKKYAYFVLSSPKAEIKRLLQPFLDSFNSSEGAAELLEQFVLAQDNSAEYDNFWHIWGLFQPLVVNLINDGYVNYRKENIVKAYLFSQRWKESAKDWHTFKPRNKSFFRKMSIELAPSNSTLYSIAKLLNDIGSGYMSEGVSWLAKVLQNNPGLADADLETNTIYYISTYIKHYLFENRTAVKQSVDLKEDLLVVLNFLIYKGEVSGYLLRESIV